MLIFEEGFEGCSLGFTHSARWAAVGTAQLDDAVAAPGSRASLSLFSGAPGNAFTQSGVERSWTDHTRPTRLRFYVRAAERQLAKAYVLLCQPDGGDDSRLFDGVVPNAERRALDVEPFIEQRHGSLEDLPQLQAVAQNLANSLKNV